jgi:hypothetical protein
VLRGLAAEEGVGNGGGEAVERRRSRGRIGARGQFTGGSEIGLFGKAGRECRFYGIREYFHLDW